MAAKSNWLSNSLLNALFNGQPITGLTTNNTATTELFLSLHTASPGAAGNATTSETTYTGYSRKALARTAAGWVITGNKVSPATTVEFGEASGVGSAITVTHVGVSVAGTGAANLLYFGALDEPVIITNGTIPRLNTTSLISEE